MSMKVKPKLEVKRTQQSLETGWYQGTDIGHTAQEFCCIEDSRKHIGFNRPDIK